MENMEFDRRKKFYCGPDHKVIPTFETLANAIREIMILADGVTMLNHANRTNQIRILASCAEAEVNKLITSSLETEKECV
jgi:hypothetical protein